MTDWTDATIASLEKLWAEGVPPLKIGEALGMTKNAIVGKAYRLGLPARPSPIVRNGPTPATKPRPVPKPRPIPLQAMAAKPAQTPAPAPVSIFRRSAECVWPIGEPGRSGFRYCAKSTVPGKPYCDVHCRKAYVQALPIRMP
jgi:GcrA cell cycle regulator